MNDKPLALIEREVRGWPEVWKKTDDNGPGAGRHPLQVLRPKADWAHPRQQSCRLPVPAGARDELIRSRQATLTHVFAVGRRRVPDPRRRARSHRTLPHELRAIEGIR